MPFPVSLFNVEFPLPDKEKFPLGVGEPHEQEYAEILHRHSAYVKEATERDQLCKTEYNNQQEQHRVLSQLPLDEEKRRENDSYLYQKQMRALYARKKMIEVNSDAGRIISRATEAYHEACRASAQAKAAAEAAAKESEEPMEVDEAGASKSGPFEQAVESSASTQTV